jgi:hypothetical protein
LEQIKEANKEFYKNDLEGDRNYWAQVLAFDNLSQNERIEIKHKMYSLDKEMALSATADQMAILKNQESDNTKSWQDRGKAAQAAIALMAATYGTDSREYEAAIASKKKLDKEFATEKLKISEEILANQRAINKIELGMEQDNTNFLKSMGAISDSAAIARTKDTNEKIYELDRQLAVEQTQLADMTSEQKQKADDKLVQLDKQHTRDMAKYEQEAALESTKYWKTAYDSITSSMSTAIKGMITEGMTFQKAMYNVIKSVLDTFITMAVQAAAKWLWSEVVMTGATTAYTAIRTAIMGTAATEAAVATTASNVGRVESETAVAAMGAASSVASVPYVGPVLAAAAAAAMEGMGQGYAVQASAAGGYDIPSGINPVVQAHAQEMILPANIANTIRGMTGGAPPGGDTHIHNWNISALDAKSFQAFARQNSSVFAGAVVQASRNFRVPS